MSAMEAVPDMAIDLYTEKRSKQTTAFVKLNVHDQAQFRLIVAKTIGMPILLENRTLSELAILPVASLEQNQKFMGMGNTISNSAMLSVVQNKATVLRNHLRIVSAPL
jgi:hypothetical protein